MTFVDTSISFDHVERPVAELAKALEREKEILIIRGILMRFFQ